MTDTPLTDPMGRTFILHDRTWFGNILKGHPDVGNYRGLVELAVSQPMEIRFNHSDPDCRLCYGRGPRAGLMMMVVADVRLGLVKTAHFAKSITGGAREWP